jgi:predicted ATPase
MKMEKRQSAKQSQASEKSKGITRITVAGYKSIGKEQSIEIRPLTILAGANSSGKSSMMQPLLLLKQTLESTYDPGPLLLNGPNIKFTSLDQLFSNMDEKKGSDTLKFGVETDASFVNIYFNKRGNKRLEIQKMVWGEKPTDITISLSTGMSNREIQSKLLTSPKLNIESNDAFFYYAIAESLSNLGETPFEFIIIRSRCFLDIGIKGSQDVRFPFGNVALTEREQSYLRELIHLPGLRGNPERSFPVTAFGSVFPGTFQEYTASIITQWQSEKNNDPLRKVGKDLERLGLTWKVTAKPINDTQVELQVGRLAHATKGGARDLVNIADVGFGVSQTLPVLVALLVAKPGQLVYIEEPEIHLHPNAQSAMAQILVDAANRGVRVVIETHSQLLLLGIQTLVAERKISPDLVKLHWFKRRNDGSTEISSADLNEAGAFGNWPEDFAEVALEAESRYLDAAESQQTIN